MPDSSPAPVQKRPLLPRILFWTGVVLCAGPVLGLLGTVFGMIDAFQVLGEGKGSDPAQLSEDISTSLWTTVAGLVAFFIGVPLLIAGILMDIYRRRRS